MEVDKIVYRHPNFTYCVGKSEQGKTYFINDLVNQLLKKKFKIVYVVNKKFPVEEDIMEKYEKNKNIFIIKCGDLTENTFNVLTNAMNSDALKMVIIDNFTYSMSPELLDFTTFSRKYNASVVFIGHSFFASKTISPRLKEVVNYIILFWLPYNVSLVRNLKSILPEEIINKYVDEVKFKNYKFVFYDNQNSTYLIDMLPHFKWEFDINDQMKPKKKQKDIFEQ